MLQETPAAANPLGVQPIGRLLTKFAVPSIVSFLVSALYNIVDQIFIGQGVGTIGNAATNVAFPLTTISVATALLFGIGTAANFNLSLGAGDRERATRILGTGLSCLVLFGLALGAVVLIFLRPLLAAFGATAENYSYAQTYAGITAFGLPLVVFSSGSSHLIRADGSPRYSMLCMVSGAIVNTILDPLFIFGFDMGIAGAALATVLGQLLSALLALRYAFHYRTVRLTRQHLRPGGALIRRIASLGPAPCFNQLAMTAAQIAMNNTLKHYGALSVYGSDIPLACVGVITKVNMLFLGFVLGISQGAQPIISFNYGARQYERVRRTYRTALCVASVFSVIAFLCFQIFPYQITALFGQGSETYFAFSVKFFRIFLLMAFTNAVNPISSNFFTAIGKAKLGVLVSLTRQVIFLIPLVLIFPIFWGVEGVMYAGPIADGVSAALAFLLALRELRRIRALPEGGGALPV